MTRATSDTPDYVTLPAWVDLAIVDDDSVPGPPTSLEATAAGPTAIDLSWAAPSDPGSSPLRGYQIEWSVDGDTVAVPFGVADWVFVDAEDHYSAVKDVLLSIVDDSVDEEAETLGLLTEMTPGMPAAWAPLSPRFRAPAPGSTTETEVGYGLVVLDSRGSLTPYLGAGLSARHGETYKAGARLRFGEFFALDAEAARLEENGATPSRYRAALLANLRW